MHLLKSPGGQSPSGLDQTVVTPHIAGATVDNFSAIIERASRMRRYIFPADACRSRMLFSCRRLPPMNLCEIGKDVRRGRIADKLA